MKKLKTLVLMSLLGFGLSTQAALPKHEVSTSLTRGFFYSGKDCKDCSTGSVLDLGGSYQMAWRDNIQFGVEGRLQYLSKEVSITNDSATLIDVLGLATYNISSDYSRSAYVKVGAGIYAVRNEAGDNYENKFGFFIGGGKRFYLMENLAYTPELRLVKKGDVDMGIQIDLINFAFHW